jgi:hypothetical protein
MKVRCVSIFIHPGLTITTNKEKKKNASSFLVLGGYSKNKENDKVATSYSAKLLFFVEINGKASYVPIEEEFKKKFEQLYVPLNKEQMERIKATMPKEINIKKLDGSLYSLHPYRVEDKDIDEWYARVRKI